jgi:hypothetical protein
MTTTNGTRQILDLKRWEYLTPAPVATGAGMFAVSSRHVSQRQLYVTSNTVVYLYEPGTDGWCQVPSPALAGTFGAGACGVASSWSTGTTVGAASLTATAGTTTTITTNQTLARDMRGYSVHILSGPNAGETKIIASNTIGASAVITFTVASGVAFSASTVYRLITPVWYVLGAGTLATGSFRKYDLATNTWTSLTITGLPATVGTDGRLVSTPSWVDDGFSSFATGTAASATSTTLAVSGTPWTASQWINAQVRITGGTGAGQIRTITANTTSGLTVATWTVTPDATSTYSIEGNDDYLYFLGNNAVTMYRYSISANTWTTLSPGVARGGAPTTGMSAHWVWGVTATDWTAVSAVQNGRYIYSLRGGGGALLDRYDIAANSWSAITYSPATETFTTGTKFAYNGDALYIQQNATGRWFRYDFARSAMDGWSTMLFPNGAAVVGDTAFDVTYIDGATDVAYIYMILNTSTVMLRAMVI